MHNDIERVLLTEEQIQKRVKELGAQLAEEYKDKNPVMICILKGSTMFFADLLRAMPIRLTMDFHGGFQLRAQHQVLRRGGDPQGPVPLHRKPPRHHRGGHHRFRLYPELLSSACSPPGARIHIDLHPAGQARPPRARHHAEDGLPGFVIPDGLW